MSKRDQDRLGGTVVKMKISVIIPCFNAGNTLIRCIDSVIAQNVESLELILVDDGSSDDTYKIAKKYEDEYPFVYLYHQDNKGVSSARNYGLSKCTGDYVTFIDCDDEIENDYYLNVLPYLEKIDIVVASIKSITNMGEVFHAGFSGTLTRQEFARDYYQYHDGGYLMSVCNKFFRRSIVNNIRFQEGRKSGEDYLFCLEAFSICKSIRFVPIHGYRYYNIGTSATHKLYKQYDNLYELDNSLKWRHTVDSLLQSIGVSDDEIHKDHMSKDVVWFYYMVTNVMNPGSPYVSKNDQIKRIRDIMDVKECRNTILNTNRNNKLGKLVKLCYTVNSAHVVYFIFRYLKK